MNTGKPAEIIFTAVEVAKAIGCQLYDLQKLQPDHFGSPGHWFLNKHSVVVYTLRGVSEFAEHLQRIGNDLAAANLRGLIAVVPVRHNLPATKSAEPYYRTHPTLA